MTKKQIQNFLVAFTTDRMTEYMIEDYNVTLSDALKFIYNSNTYAKLSQTENGLYSQSPAYVYELLEKEYLPYASIKKQTRQLDESEVAGNKHSC